VSVVSRRRKSEGFADVSIGGPASPPVSIGEVVGAAARSEPGTPVDIGGTPVAPAPPPDADEFVRRAQQITLHRESSGRGGRTVTMVTTRPEPDVRTSEALAKVIRKGLGCGSHVEGPRIVLHGDIMDRAKEWFEKRGARRVVRGN
jgi:translation initiation factor 1 (eIF-1/SUI1)